jgi:hypothetical protein
MTDYELVVGDVSSEVFYSDLTVGSQMAVSLSKAIPVTGRGGP